ncbi:hypothetical protein H4R35_000209 [Dimargaris xerosporica]|nr:hypothetical protein H4R35_000209 [Dimargaris xerosporica]
MAYTGGKRKWATPKARQTNTLVPTSKSAASAVTTHGLPGTTEPTETITERVPEIAPQPKGILRRSDSVKPKPRKKGKQFVTDTEALLSLVSEITDTQAPHSRAPEKTRTNTLAPTMAKTLQPKPSHRKIPTLEDIKDQLRQQPKLKAKEKKRQKRQQKLKEAQDAAKPRKRVTFAL